MASELIYGGGVRRRDLLRIYPVSQTTRTSAIVLTPDGQLDLMKGLLNLPRGRNARITVYPRTGHVTVTAMPAAKKPKAA
jgi:hypothetical protein